MFKVGDVIRLKSDSPLNSEWEIANLGNRSYTVYGTGSDGRFNYVSIRDEYGNWFVDKRFEIDKNTIVTNILNDI